MSNDNCRGLLESVQEELTNMGFGDPDQSIDGADFVEYGALLFEELTKTLEGYALPSQSMAAAVASAIDALSCEGDFVGLANKSSGDQIDIAHAILTEAVAKNAAYTDANPANPTKQLGGAVSPAPTLPAVLDACCGSRMMWFDKQDDRALFVDRRKERIEMRPDKSYPSGCVINVDPDMQLDFTCLPFQDGTFALVVFDPPHLQREEAKGCLTYKYGVLNGDWRAMLRDGFAECFRVLRPEGVLIFKWAETEVPVREILSLTDVRPLFGHKSGKQMGTHWMTFIKPPNQQIEAKRKAKGKS